MPSLFQGLRTAGLLLAFCLALFAGHVRGQTGAAQNQNQAQDDTLYRYSTIVTLKKGKMEIGDYELYLQVPKGHVGCQVSAHEIYIVVRGKPESCGKRSMVAMIEIAIYANVADYENFKQVTENLCDGPDYLPPPFGTKIRIGGLDSVFCHLKKEPNEDPARVQLYGFAFTRDLMETQPDPDKPLMHLPARTIDVTLYTDQSHYKADLKVYRQLLAAIRTEYPK